MGDALLMVFNYVAVIISLIGVGISVFSLIKAIVQNRTTRIEEDKDPEENIQDLLEKLSAAQDEAIPNADKIASLFNELGRSGYVTLHKLTNAGGKHSDKVQEARFRHMLTPQAAKRLNCIRG
jgi:biopolymer transport protein ExbB/TolQ